MKDIFVKTFKDLNLNPALLRAIEEEGYTTPTPIQARSIPVLLDGHDLVGIAQTGTGKTAAFVLPLINRLMAEKKQAPGRTCRALILSPTRELAAQIDESIRTYGRHCGLKHSVIFGGVKPGPQIRKLAEGLDILVATPGRLLDHFQGGKARLDFASTVILDEADQMMDLGFIPAIRRILAATPKSRQTIMFSATMPGQIRKLADDFLNQAVTVSVTPQAKTVDKIDQGVMYVDNGDKRAALIDIMAPTNAARTIIFTRTKRGADKVAKHLSDYGHATAAIHGNKSQSQREKALAAFKVGKTPVLVATDIAARGIDIDDVKLVINYELPNVAESYVHRIGRTARAGADGKAIALCAPEERGMLADIEKLIGQSIPGLNEAPPRQRELEGGPKPKRQRQRNRKPRSGGGQNSSRGKRPQNKSRGSKPGHGERAA